MSEKVLVRFAPSPTGWLHVGNVRTALINFLFAKHAGGTFMLRVDDTDKERSKAEFEAGLKEDLQWLGLQWDETFKQSDRMDRYDLARKMLIGRGLPPVYDRSALKDTDEKRKEYETQGRKPHWRFKLNAMPIEWEDMIRGPVHFDGAKLSDPVLIREDGAPLFTFTTSVDDGEYPITHIIRGEDHVSNTAIQVQIMEALGHKVPKFGHMALLKMKEGKISKRAGGGDIRSLRDAGILPLALISYLSKIGTSDAIDVAESLSSLTKDFNIGKLGRSMANYDPNELERLNQKLLHHLAFADVKALLEKRGMGAITQDFWEAIKPNLHMLDEVRDWWDVLHKPITPKIDNAEFTNTAVTLLPQGQWGESSWDEFVNAVKEKTGRKGKELFMPLRLALTGMEHGPEMKTVFALLGRERAEKRLKGEAA